MFDEIAGARSKLGSNVSQAVYSKLHKKVVRPLINDVLEKLEVLRRRIKTDSTVVSIDLDTSFRQFRFRESHRRSLLFFEKKEVEF